MAEDLLAVADETLKSMIDLERRAGEVSQVASKLTATASQHTADLATAQTNFDTRLGDFNTHLADLQSKLDQAGVRVGTRIGTQIAEIKRQSDDVAAKHKVVRQHLKDMRTGLTTLKGDADRLEKATLKDLNTVRTETATLLAGTALALDKAEEALRTVMTPHVIDTASQITSRSNAFKKHVDTVLVPRIKTDATNLSGRVTAIGLKLATLMTKAHTDTLENSKTHLTAFQNASGTDWRGGGGDVEAAERAGQLQRLGGEHSQELDGAESLLKEISTRFETLVNTISQQYREVYAVPGQIQQVAARAK